MESFSPGREEGDSRAMPLDEAERSVGLRVTRFKLVNLLFGSCNCHWCLQLIGGVEGIKIAPGAVCSEASFRHRSRKAMPTQFLWKSQF